MARYEGIVNVVEYRHRRLDDHLDRLLSEHPAVMLTGPRATGKTTTAVRHCASVVRLDVAAEAAAFGADADAALRGLDEPILIDEWQVVPESLGAVKRAVDAEPRPGRFVVTGSVRGDLTAVTWPGTGRLIRTAVHGLTVAEQRGDWPTHVFIDRLLQDRLVQPADPPDVIGYVELALRGGYPEPALALGAEARGRWLESYIDELVTRDAQEASGGRDPVRLGRYLEAVALNSAGVVDHKTIYDAARINKKTASDYEALLHNLLVVESMPAWTTNRLKRLLLAPKRYLTDASLLAGVTGVDVDAVRRDGDLLGRVIDTFAVSQLRADLPYSSRRCRLHHLRTEQGRREVDVVVEIAGSELIGVEIKATAAPTRNDARHLAWLRDELGSRFRVGVVLHTGPRQFELGERLIAVPIASLWV